MSNQTQLITRTELKTWAQISEHVEDVVLNPYILSAQSRFLRDLWGKDLYEEVLAQKAADSLTYLNQSLLTESIPFLAYAIKSFWIPNAHVMSSQKGYMKALDDYAEHLTGKETEGMVDANKIMLETARRDIENFLKENESDYPLYAGSCNNRTTAERTGGGIIGRIGGKKRPRRTNK